MLNIINKKGPVDQLYIAAFIKETVGIWAMSDGQAKQRAVEHYRPKKNQKDQIDVTRV